MKEELREERFVTTDFGLTVALITQGFEPIEIKTVDRKRVQFEFLQPDKIAEYAERYYTNRLLLPAQRLHLNAKELKNRIFPMLNSK